MTNFKIETLEHIRSIGKTKDDVLWVLDTTEAKKVKFDDFIADCDFNYHGGFGNIEINPSLIIYYTDNSYSVRDEYDGMEGWSYRPIINVDLFTETKELEIR